MWSSVRGRILGNQILLQTFSWIENFPRLSVFCKELFNWLYLVICSRPLGKWVWNCVSRERNRCFVIEEILSVLQQTCEIGFVWFLFLYVDRFVFIELRYWQLTRFAGRMNIRSGRGELNNRHTCVNLVKMLEIPFYDELHYCYLHWCRMFLVRFFYLLSHIEMKSFVKFARANEEWKN